MGKTKDLGHLAHIVAYDTENHITVPAGITMHTNQLVASQAWVTTALGSYALSSSLGSYVPTSRTITINGTTYDLSANRSWDITSMIYPAAGIPLSTGSAWGTSITNNSANWNTAYGWGNHASAGYLTGITSTQVTTALGYTPVTNARTITINGTAYDLSANREWTVSGSDSTKLPLAGGTMTGSIVMATSGTSYIRMGNFPNVTTNSGEAWIGRASDRSTGTMTVQLGSSNSSVFEVVDYGWTTVTLRAGMNDFTYKGNTIYHAGNIPTWNQSTTGNAATATNAQGVSFLTQPNSTWGGRVQLGGNGGGSGVANIAVVQATDGNLHMDSGNGKGIYLNYYQAGTIYLNGGTYYISSNGSYYNGRSANSDALNGWGYGAYAYRASGSGYYQVDTWMQMNGNHGIYWPSYYGAHIYPNQSSYGPIQINGSKNGWNGMHFDTGTTLMMNSNSSGHHREGYGWQFRWENGTMYCGKNSYGGGTDATMLDTSNYTSWTMSIGTNQDITGIKYFLTNNDYYLGNTNTAKLQAYSHSNYSAFMSFHKSGHYAVNFGLDADNVMRIGGWSAAANRWQLDMSGNMTVAGDVTAYSDARVKENVKTIENALNKVLSLRGVSYNRTDSDDKKTKIGVIAQETLEVVPEVVNMDNMGMYNVSYGNMGGLFIEAFKEQQKKIDSQDKIIEQLKELVYGLTR